MTAAILYNTETGRLVSKYTASDQEALSSQATDGFDLLYVKADDPALSALNQYWVDPSDGQFKACQRYEWSVPDGGLHAGVLGTIRVDLCPPMLKVKVFKNGRFWTEIELTPEDSEVRIQQPEPIALEFRPEVIPGWISTPLAVRVM